MTLTPARFIAQYNALGVRFELQAGAVVSIGASPVFCEWCIEHSDWLKQAVIQQASQRKIESSSVQDTVTSTVESTHADRLIWDGIQNARRNDARVKAIVRGRR